MSDSRDTRGVAARPRPLLGFAASSFVVGAVLMLLFESALSRVAGLAALFAFIVAGVFLVAAPDFLEAEDPGDPFPPAPPGFGSDR